MGAVSTRKKEEYKVIQAQVHTQKSHICSNISNNIYCYITVKRRQVIASCQKPVMHMHDSGICTCSKSAFCE